MPKMKAVSAVAEVSEVEKEPTKKEKIIALGKELYESQEEFEFTGLTDEAFSKMRADEKEYPGYTTPIGELMKKFSNVGMKVVLGKNPESGNVYILPVDSDNIEMDSISPKQLRINDAMSEKLKELILLVRG